MHSEIKGIEMEEQGMQKVTNICKALLRPLGQLPRVLHLKHILWTTFYRADLFSSLYFKVLCFKSLAAFPIKKTFALTFLYDTPQSAGLHNNSTWDQLDGYG